MKTARITATANLKVLADSPHERLTSRMYLNFHLDGLPEREFFILEKFETDAPIVRGSSGRVDIVCHLLAEHAPFFTVGTGFDLRSFPGRVSAVGEILSVNAVEFKEDRSSP